MSRDKHVRFRPSSLPLAVRITGIGVVILILMVLVMLFFSGTVQTLTQLRRDQETSQKRAALINAELTAIVDMETGLRAHRLTGADAFLGPYNTGHADFVKASTELRPMLADDPSRLHMQDKLDDLVSTWLITVAEPALTARRENNAHFDYVSTTTIERMMVDEMRALLAEMSKVEAEHMQLTTEQSLLSAQTAQQRTYLVGLLAAILSFGFSILLARNVSRPLQRMVAAMQSIAAEGGGVQLPVTSEDEVGRLTRGFNRMSESLARQQTNLAAQNEELQAIQEELSAQNEELQAQQEELTHLVDELEVEKARLQEMNGFSDAIVATADLRDLGERILAGFMASGQADVGALILTRRDHPPEMLAGAGLTAAALAAGPLSATGLAARTMAERHPLVASYPDGELLRPVYHTVLPVQHELYLPIGFNNETLGVLVLGRTRDPWELKTRQTLELMSRPAAAALSNALAFERVGAAYANIDAILRATSEGIRLVNLAGESVIINDRFWELLGLEPGAELPPEARMAAGHAATNPDWIGTETFELDLPQPVILQQYTAPAIDRHGNRIGRVYVLRDITRETAVDRMKTEFISTVSHELRTPLTAIRGYVDLILEGDAGEITAEQRDYLAIVSRSSVRLSNLISDLLDVEKIESGRIELRNEPVAVGPILEHVVETLRVSAAEKGLQLDLLLPPAPLPTLSGDIDRLTQVFTNLVANAIKYTKQGWVQVTAGYGGNGQISVAVSDTGIGLAPDDTAKLFTKFFRVDNQYTREVGGTGLGLAISQAIVQKHGGEIEVESAPGRGSTFRVKLPILGTAAPVARLDRVAQRETNRRLVLVVEDDADLARLISQHAERHGLQALIVANGKEALELARYLQPDLITLDVMLPGMDGWEVISHLKRDPRTASIPVVFISVLEEVDKGLRLGAAGYLTKPLDPHRLVQTLEQILPAAKRPVLLALLSPEREVTQSLLVAAATPAVLASRSEPLAQQLLAVGAGTLVLDKEWSTRDTTAEIRDIYSTDGLQEIRIFVVDQPGAQPAETLVAAILRHLTPKL